MKVKFLKKGRLFIVFQTHSQQILFSHRNKTECYEWIFKQLSYV